MTSLELLASFAVGFLTGVYAALFGLGGGFIFVPYFYLGLGMPIYKAVGSSLTSIIFVTSSAVAAYSFQRRVDFRLALLLMVTAAPSAFLGAWLTRFLTPHFLRVLFTVLLAYAGVNMILEVRFERARRFHFSFLTLWRRTSTDRWGESFEYDVNPLLVILGGAGVGLISGMTGVGGGILNIPLMCLFLGIPIHVAVATSELATLINVASGSFGHFLAGNIDFQRVVTVGFAAFLGAQVGSKVSRRIRPRVLSRAFGLILLLLAFKMVISS